MSVRLEPIFDARGRNRFIDLPHRLYRGDPFWVAPLRRDERRLHDPAIHPFHRHADVQLWIAHDERGPVGRIAASVNHRHNEFHEEKTGFFGFFESVNDPAVAGVLVDAAAGWCRERGQARIRGPMNYSTNETCGLLVDGFDGPPVLMMTYNPPWYAALLEGCGLSKSKDLLAYWLADTLGVPERIARIADRVMKKQGVVLRRIDMRRYEAEVEVLLDLYNRSWVRNWGFVPMTPEEFRYMATEMRPILDPDLLLIGEVNGEPVGFVLELPDFNEALIAARGSLFPFGLLKLLWRSRSIRYVRVITLGVVPEHRARGMDAVFYTEIWRRGTAKGYHAGELSWILEDNAMMTRGAAELGGKVYRRYRVYEKTI